MSKPIPAASATSAIDLIAFYNPGFRSRNDRDGFGPDEWAEVRRGRQGFRGHLQPIEPDELGYYDLRDRQTIEAQSALAKGYGIAGFCWRVDWSYGQRGMPDALDAMVSNPKIDMPFCLCWANGEADDQDQRRDETANEGDPAFIQAALKYLKDARYLRVGGRPILLVLNPGKLRNGCEIARHWKSVAWDAGCGELHLCAVETDRGGNQPALGFDALVEMAPRQPLPPLGAPSAPLKLLDASFRGAAFEYQALRAWHLDQPFPRAPTYYRTVVPRWDTTAAGRDAADVALGATPREFEEWLYWAGLQTLLAQPPGHRLLFINSWNDWRNGSILEPDRHYQREYLEAARDAVRRLNERAPVFDQYWPALEAMGKSDNASAEDIRSIIFNYERSLAALRTLERPITTKEGDAYVGALPLRRLTELYVRRARQALQQSQPVIAEILQAVPLGTLTRAYLQRLSSAIWRRARRLTSRSR